MNGAERLVVSDKLGVTLDRLRKLLADTCDLKICEADLHGVRVAAAAIEGMASPQLLADAVFSPLRLLSAGAGSPREVFDILSRSTLLTADRQVVSDLDEISLLLFSGFAAVFVDGIAEAAAFGVQGYERKSVGEPSSEHNIMGSQEGFCESIKTNVSLVRRRLRTPKLRFESINVGELTQTEVCIAYIRGRAPSGLAADIKRRLTDTGLDTLLASGSLRPLLEKNEKVGLFSEISATERPDVVCSRLCEGRAAVLADGSPFALIVPSLFAESFRTVDDACSKPYFVLLMRMIRFIAFFFAVMFPGLYVAAANYHPEMLTLKLLLNLTASERSTPYSLFVEMLIITVLLELMKEASVRMPKAVGSAISIAGGLVIGDAAVKSGIISSPLLIIVGLTATASFVIPSLSQQSSALRLCYIVAGGAAGFFGIAVVSGMIMTNAASLEYCGAAYTAPLLPFSKKAAGDIFIRRSTRSLARTHTSLSGIASAGEGTDND